MTITKVNKVTFKGQCNRCKQMLQCDDTKDLGSSSVGFFFGNCPTCLDRFVPFYPHND